MAFLCSTCMSSLLPDRVLCDKCGSANWNPIPVRDAAAFAGPTIKASDLVDAADVDASAFENIITGGPWDPCLSLKGGPVRGGTYLVAGLAGGGKTTMLLQIAARLFQIDQKPCYYVSGEQAKEELKGTIDRFKISLGRGQLILAKSMNNSGLIDDAVLAANPPSCVIVDSLSEICGQKNYDLQVALARAHKEPIAVKYRCPVFMISQMNKAGDTLGMSALQHGPDALIEVSVIDDGRRRARILRECGLEDGDVRMLMGVKNRFGPTHVEQPMLMTSAGFAAVPKAMRRDRQRRTGDPLRDLLLDKSWLEEDATNIKISLRECRGEIEEIEEKILKLASKKPATGKRRA